jgi:SAM-dependent methyltransferase
VRWYIKALIQNGVARLPEKLALPVYYQLQRNFGELRYPRFDMRFRAAADVARALREVEAGVAGRRFLEVGTGRTVDLPMGLWLMGAAETVTVDIDRLLRPELVHESMGALSRDWDTYRALFAEHAEDADALDARFAELERWRTRGVSSADLPELLRTMGIDYRSPADATSLALDGATIDCFVTFVVLQHVPRGPMREILREARRVLKPDGQMVHVVNTSDHFSHVDDSLSPLAFLRYSERAWDLIAGNRFMYQNRLRADDYYALFRELGLAVAHTEEMVDERALEDLKSGLPLHPDWRGNAPERDAVIRFTVVLRKDDAEAKT